MSAPAPSAAPNDANFAAEALAASCYALTHPSHSKGNEAAKRGWNVKRFLLAELLQLVRALAWLNGWLSSGEWSDGRSVHPLSPARYLL